MRFVAVRNGGRGCFVKAGVFWALAPLAFSQDLPRHDALPLPLFGPESAWNQLALGVPVTPESDAQILRLYRVLRGDTRTLMPAGPAPTTWPFMDVNFEDWSIPIFLAGSGEARVLLCDYDGNRGGESANLVLADDGSVTVASPAGSVRPAGPTGSESDGHLVLYDPVGFAEYDFWQATTARSGPCASHGGGIAGATVLEAGAVERFDVGGTGSNVDGYSSARAVGTPLLAGLLVPEDIERGVISHAIAVAIPGLRNTAPDPEEPTAADYFYPASTTETDFYNTDPVSLAAGQHLRLRASLVDEEGNAVIESELAPITRMFLAALRSYGLYIVDNAGGFSVYAEDVQTAQLALTDGEVATLIGAPGTALPADRTRWQIALDTLATDLERIPFAYGPWTDGQDAGAAEITTANWDVIENAIPPATP